MTLKIDGRTREDQGYEGPGHEDGHEWECMEHGHYDVLDRGYLRFVEYWGSDQAIIETARMSTDKGFLGWDRGHGMAKEVARLNTPVSRYSRMRATGNLRNWLAFLTLRMAPGAQFEIRQYAWALADIVQATFPRTWELAFEGMEFLPKNIARLAKEGKKSPLPEGWKGGST